ncbi:hypothetical protein BaRGS_00030296 [Batillaria attramentaria]|uniref:Uncharacterized protein n=1 Tax=Batillaria attramentaria TaxID=370345 RepID=A0ABD0JUV7_9CAEN
MMPPWHDSVACEAPVLGKNGVSKRRTQGFFKRIVWEYTGLEEVEGTGEKCLLQTSLPRRVEDTETVALKLRFQGNPKSSTCRKYVCKILVANSSSTSAVADPGADDSLHGTKRQVAVNNPKREDAPNP